MYCSSCGAANPDGADVKYCRSCGLELAQPPSIASRTEPPPGLVPVLAGAMPAVPMALAASAASAPALLPATSVLPYGGFWIRLVACIIDSVVIWVLYFGLGIVGVIAGALAGTEANTIILIISLISFVFSAAYQIVPVPVLGATPGKLLLGLHIVGRDGRHVGYGRSAARFFSQMLSGLAFALGYIWIGIDPYKQGWHDKIAGTFVVRREFVKPR